MVAERVAGEGDGAVVARRPGGRRIIPKGGGPRPIRLVRPLARPFVAPAWAIEAGPDLSPEEQDYEIDYMERHGYAMLRVLRTSSGHRPYNALVSVRDAEGVRRDYLARLGRRSDVRQADANLRPAGGVATGR